MTETTSEKTIQSDQNNDDTLEKKSLIEALKTYFTPRGIVMSLFGFSAGLPFFLIFQTLSIWLREEGVSKGDIGLFAFVGFAFTLKFLWAPALDRVPIPILEKKIGRRRAWMATAQIGVASALFAMSFANPAANLFYVAVVSILIAFSSATQDIAVDAWRIEAADDTEQGMMAAMYQYGYRTGILIATTAPLFIAEYVDWPTAYRTMAALMGIGFCVALFAPRVETGTYTPPKRLPPLQAFQASVIGPFADFFNRFGFAAITILAFIALYRVPDFVMGFMTGPLYVDVGYPKDQIAAIKGGAGTFATMLGVFLGGVILLRLNFLTSLFIGVIVQSVTNLLYAWLAVAPADPLNLATAVIIDNIAYGYAGTILIAYMSSLTNTAFTATQYALFSSFYAIPGKFVGGFSGFIVEAVDYSWFFVGTALVGLPALGMIFLLRRAEQEFRDKQTPATG
ncbi:MAG: MFS transporter [Pseudomonadota bacterium]